MYVLKIQIKRCLLKIYNLNSQKKKKKLLILGGSSLLAYLWVKEVNYIYEIYITKNKCCTNYMGLEAIEIDIFSKNSVQRILESLKKSYIKEKR